MTTEIAVLADGNPLLSLRGPDGRWSARDVQKSGHVHSRWVNWEDAIKRGLGVLDATIGAGDAHIHPSMKMVQIGQGKERQTSDYSMDEWGLLASLQKSDIPEIDLWFTAAALQALGFVPGGAREEKPVRKKLIAATPYQLAQWAAAGLTSVTLPDGTVLHLDGNHARRWLDDWDEGKKARVLEAAERARLALPSPRKVLPWPKRDDEAPWDYESRLHRFFNEGDGDWDHVAEFLAKHRFGAENWPQHYEHMRIRVQEFAQLYPEVQRPDWGLANAALTYVDDHYPAPKPKD